MPHCDAPALRSCAAQAGIPIANITALNIKVLIIPPRLFFSHVTDCIAKNAIEKATSIKDVVRELLPPKPAITAMSCLPSTEKEAIRPSPSSP
jgi:hypothetical protein